MKIVLAGPSSSKLVEILGDCVVIDGSSDTALVNALIGGAAEGAAVVIDAAEGLSEQLRRYSLILHLLGLRRVLVALDPAGPDARDYRAFLDGIGVEGWPMIAAESLAEGLEGLPAAVDLTALPLRLAIESVAGLVATGRVLCGQIAIGDALIFSPSHLTARVTALKARGASVAVTLDQTVAVAGGDLASLLDDLPLETDVFRVKVVWLNGSSPDEKRAFSLQLNGQKIPVELQEYKAGELGYSELIIRAPGLLALDEFDIVAPTGRCVLIDSAVGGLVAIGVIVMEGYPDQRGLIEVKSTNVTFVEHSVSADSRAERNGHRSGVLWFTGLSGSGKSTLAIEVEQRLFRLGYQAYVLDGDNMRRGLNVNLGFSPDDRAENIRRVGQVAALFADAGFLVISAFISPYLSDRIRARAAVEVLGADRFYEIFIDADLEECERRDPKGLYKRARSGEITDFTGISAPYEAPENPDMTIDTKVGSVDACAQAIVEFIVAEFAHS
jgi:bifunctional enzyme CysN/CysC